MIKSAHRHEMGLDLRAVAQAVWQRCRETDYCGWDPYDGLKSRLLAPLLDRSQLLSLAVIQGVKRCPVNLRPVLGIPAGRNPKGLALLLHAVSRLPRLAEPGDRDRIADLLAATASRPDGSAILAERRPGPELGRMFRERTPDALGWGYDFPWKSKVFNQPAFYPTVVATSFVVDAFAAAAHPYHTAATGAAAALVRNHLTRHEDQTGCCYSYSPSDNWRVFNASLFAGKILARAALDAEAEAAPALRAEAAATVEYVVARQQPAGGWVYGEAPHWQWIDNLHSGFVLETIADIARLLGEPERWADALARGLAYYRANLFGADATPYYYAGRRWPLDSHTVAQAALTLLAFCDREPALATQARRVLEVGIERLYDPARRGFHYQRGPLLTNRTIFLRWSQAWMLHALCAVIAHEERAA